jgi:hypothetical protein
MIAGGFETRDEGVDGPGLITGGFVGGDELEDALGGRHLALPGVRAALRFDSW